MTCEGSAARVAGKDPESPKKAQLEQLHLELGQRDLGISTCSKCGMVYNRLVEGDFTLHAKFHISYLQSKKFPVCSETDLWHFTKAHLNLVMDERKSRRCFAQGAYCHDQHFVAHCTETKGNEG